MRAAVLHEFGQPLRLEETTTPEPGAGEVLVKVHACGVCHSDLHLAEADWEMLKRITKLPLVLGHEAAGAVAAVGEGVTGFRVGDRVGVPWLHWTCGECEYCRSGRETLCPVQAITGVTVDGGFADYVKAKASHIARIPDVLTLEEAAPLFCAGLTTYKALKQAGVSAGQGVAIFGAGGLGHLAIQFAKARGARVAAVDVADDKLELSKECGADAVFHGGRDNLRKSMRSFGAAQVVVVCAASKAAYESALACVAKGGPLVAVGMPAEPFQVSAVALIAGEIRIISSAVGTREDLAETLTLAAASGIRCRHEVRPMAEVNEVLARLKSGGITGRVVLSNTA